MGHRTNHGSVGIRNGHPQWNGAALSQQVLQQEMAEKQAQGFIHQTMIETGSRIYANLVGNHVPFPADGQPYDVEMMRFCAAFAKEAAMYYAEAWGMVRIEPKKTEGEEKSTPDEPAASIGQKSNDEPPSESRIILP